MKYTSKKLPDSVVEVEVNLDHQEFLEYYQPVYDAALSAVHLKGFRPGAAPKEMADKAVDKEKVFHEAVSKAAREALREITQDNSWQLIDQPKIEVLDSEKGLKFKAAVSVFPEVKLGDYKKISKKLFSEKKPILTTDKEVEDSIKWVLNSRAKLTRVNRETKNGDVVDVDFSGKAGGKDLDGATGKSDSFVLGEGKFIKGFEENLIGCKEGEHLEFSVNFPNDYWKKELQNQKVDFKVDLKSVFNREIPELTDDFAKTIGKFENVEALKTSVKEGINKEKNGKENERLRLKILEEIVKNSKIELPEIMVSRTLDNMVSEYRQYEAMNPSKELKTDGEIRKNLEAKAKNSVATNLVLYEIAKIEKLEPASEEVEAEANQLVKNLPKNQTKGLDIRQIYDYSYGVVQNRKVFEYLESLK